MSDAAGGLTIRRLATHAEYEACVRLQHETWGEGFREAVPASVLLVAHEIGGVVAGAFDAAGTLAGFVFGLTGVRGGRLVHWSDMLAVRPALRGGGLGVRLKEFQRDLVRPLGVEAILWTFDPLVARNAHLNLTRLGARVVEYVVDMYGGDTGSPLHGALGTDRLIVEWDARGGGTGLGTRDSGLGPDAPRVPSSESRVPSPVPAVRVEIPRDVHALLAADPDAAAEWRRATRRALGDRLARGWRVARFDGGPRAERPSYLLVPTDTSG